MTLLWIIWSLWLLQAFVSLLNSVLYRIRMRRQDKRLALPYEGEPKRAVILLPVKYDGEDLQALYHTLVNQDYANYRVMVITENESDPAWQFVDSKLKAGEDAWAKGCNGVQLHVAGLAKQCGQKVHNLTSGIHALSDDDEYIVFADADMTCVTDWLRRLVAPLNHGTHDIATTYRWLFPVSNNLPTDLCAMVNQSVATLGGPEWCNLCWGGSTAIPRGTATKLDLPHLLEGCLNDDLRIGGTARGKKLRIAYIRSLLRPSPIDYDWRRMIEFARRQYFQVRVYTPHFWAIALAGCLLYFTGFLTAWWMLLSGYLAAGWVLLAVFLLNLARGWQRVGLAKELFEGRFFWPRQQKLHKYEYFGTSLFMLAHLGIVLSSAFVSRIWWAGVLYHVKGKQGTTVLSRGDTRAVAKMKGQADTVG